MFLGDNKFCKMTDIGTVKFCLHGGTKRILEEVKYISIIKQNLISLGELQKKRYYSKYERGVKGVDGAMES